MLSRPVSQRTTDLDVDRLSRQDGALILEIVGFHPVALKPEVERHTDQNELRYIMSHQWDGRPLSQFCDQMRNGIRPIVRCAYRFLV